MTSTVGLAALTTALLLYTWRTAGQHRDLTARLTQATSDCCRARAKVLEERAKNRRLRFKLAATGFAPPRIGAPWPGPDQPVTDEFVPDWPVDLDAFLAATDGGPIDIKGRPRYADEPDTCLPGAAVQIVGTA